MRGEELVCEAGPYTDQTLSFDSTAEFTYATAPEDFLDFWSFTACWWMRTNDATGQARAIFSYFASGDNPGSIIVQTASNLRACIKNVWGTSSGVSVTYGMWHHVCVTWASDGGQHEFYRDGGRVFSQSNLSVNKMLRGGGKLVIGQRQMTTGTYNRAYSYTGDLSEFNMWSEVLLASEIEGFAENRGCENGCGDLITWSSFTSSDLTEVDVSDADAVCEDRVTECGEGEFDDKKWTLESTTSQFSYATFRQSIPNLSKFSACMWVKTTATSTNYYLFTYTTSNVNTGGIYLLNPNSVKLGVNNGAATASGVAINYGLWFHICQTWTSAGGAYQYYKDANMRLSGVNLRTNVEINGGGTLIIGQYQSTPGGGFNTVYSFNGEITKFNIWSKVLSSTEIEEMYTEPCGYICGDIVWWSFFRSDDTASITVEDHGLQCEEEELVCEAGPYTNQTLSFDSTAEFTYATAPEDFLDFWSFSACWWMRTNDATGQARAIFSYFASGDNPGSIIVQTASNLRACIKNVWGTSSSISVTYGIWHHVCVTWASDGGQHEFYRDGGRAFSQSNLAVNKMLRGGGKLVIGQRQMTTGTYNRAYSYTGDLSEFNMWSEVLLASDIERFAENRGCDNGCGDLVTWASFTSSDLTEVDVSDADAVCQPRVDCENGEFDEKVLVLDSTDDFGVVQSFQTMPDLTEFTMCWWLRSSDTAAASYLVSYVTSNRATGNIYIYNPTTITLYVNNVAGIASTIRVNYGLWHHVCVTWESGGGNYFYYKDGIMTKTWYNLRKGATILGGGSLMLGQYQTSVGGGLNKVYSFDHEVSKFNIWTEVLQSRDITKLANDACDPSCGDAISWSYFRSSDISTAVTVKDSDIPCGPELPLCNGGEYDGKKWRLDNTVTYSYARSSRTVPDLFQFTVCSWVKTTDTYVYSTLFTYSAVGQTLAIMVWNFGNLQLYVNNGAATASTVTVNYDRWSHLCFTWDRSDGTYSYYHDGAVAKSGTNLKANGLIPGNGDFIIGGRLTAVDGSLMARTYFMEGEISNFNLWSTILTDDKIERIALEGCQNDCGDVLSWASFTSDELTEIEVLDSEIECRYEPECGGGPFENDTFVMDSSELWSYVQITRAVPDLQEFTMCWWMRTTDTVAYRRSLVSYFAPGAGYYSTIWVEYPTNLRMWVKGTAGPYTNIKVNYGLWHHVCFTWNSNGGTYKAYKDGELRYSSVNLRSFETIDGNGVLVLGQRQTSYGGGFHKYYAYYGDLANFNWWSEAKDADEIKGMAVAPCDSDCGDIMMWSILTASDVINVEKEENDIPCSPEMPKCYGGEFKGKVWEFDSTAEYTYVNVDKTIRDQDGLTISFWMKTTDSSNLPRSLVSYFALGDSYGSVVLEYVHNMRLWIGNQAGAFSSMEVNYGLWHHVCVTWSTVEGRYQYFKDANLAYTNINLRKDQLIRGGGEMVIGQKQASLGGGFTRNRAYIGEMTSFNVWGEVIADEAIQAMADDGCLDGCGNLVWWPSFTSDDLTEVDVVDSDIQCVDKDRCHGGTFKGKAWLLDNSVDWSYATVPKELPDMTEFSICLWLKTPESNTNYYSTVFSYLASGDWYSSIVFSFPRNLRLYVINQWGAQTSKKVDDGSWHYLCVTWSSDGGIYKLYDQGTLQHSGSGLASGKTIKGAGSFVIGQNQYWKPGYFYRSYSWNGNIMNFNMWSTVLDKDELGSSENMCKGGCGDLMSWHEFTYFDVTSVSTTKMRCRTNPDGSIDLEEGEDETTETPPVVATTAEPMVPTEEPVVPTEEATEPVVIITAAPSITTEEFVIVTPEVTTEACIVPDDMDNFAVGGEASQSSVRGGGKPKKAIDGNADSNMSTGKSCSRTLEERDPWWMVDIGRSTNVYKVTITNRQDCCSEDLVGAEVRVGNSPNLDDNDVCGAQVTESDIANENIEIICACGEPINGRYVSVHLPGITRSLTLCEVSVGGIAVATEKPEECVVPPNLINVAAGKQASQISDAGKATASRAVDGDKNSNYKEKSCSKTGSESDPWWSVDLGDSRDVYQVTITNRQDCCAERILDAEVRVGDSRNIARNALCGTKVTEDEMNQETIVLICACGDPLNGRFVSVQLAGSARALTLCEVEVWTEGTLTVAPTLAPDVSTIEFFTTEEPCVFPESIEDVIHAGSVVEQSSTKKSNVAARAVDGNKNSVLSEGSCSMTNKEFEPWFKVDLGVSRDIHQVTITNRADCCSFRLKGAVVRVGDNPDHTKNPICGGPLNDRRVKEETVPVICGCDDPMPGRYISVQLFDKTQQLTICEIEAFAMPLASPVPPAEHTTAAASYTTEEPCVLPDDVVNIATPSTAAEQSSTKSGNDATRAVDGNKSGTLSDGHCAMTKKETEPWIQLDLGQQRQVHQVSITNRQDCCSFRLKGAVIRVGDSPNVGENPMCGSGPISDRRVRQATIDIVCGCEVPMAGRYVSVQLEDKTNTLAICELEVFAAP
ncbi:uncharacterized protein [Ptychodera flava]|uniref:uncharacterized protein isoform X2 n=1 Tax=Ptychodera flava TaxID=63121 RepID=UPI00396A0D5E